MTSFFPSDFASKIFQYIQEDHEPLDEDDPSVYVFRLIVIPEKRAQLCAKLDAAFGGYHEYVDHHMFPAFKSDTHNIYFYPDFPMTKLYAMEQQLGSPSTSKKTRKALMDSIFSRITLMVEMVESDTMPTNKVMEALTSE